MTYTTITAMAAVTEHGEKANMFASIGIDWKLLVLQTIAFLILLWVLKKFVYPPLVAMLDKREAEIAEASEAAKKAQARADASQDETKKLLAEARKEAGDIVSTAKEEASAMVAAAEQKSKDQAERIVAAAHDDIAREVTAAKKALHNETIDLVASATEKVVGKAVSKDIDTKVIKTAVEDAR